MQVHNVSLNHTNPLQLRMAESDEVPQPFPAQGQAFLQLLFSPSENTKSFFRRDVGPQQGALNIITSSFSLEATSSL